MHTPVQVGNVTFANDGPFSLIAGPCQLENLDHARMLAEKIGNAASAPAASATCTTDWRRAPSQRTETWA